MAFKKKVASNHVDPLNKKESDQQDVNKKDFIEELKPEDFHKGTQYVRDGIVWTVTEEFISDNTEMRRVVGSDGTNEIVTLRTLKSDMKTPGFAFLK